ncbi:MAG: hypothetical protein A2Y17_02025 [Clostridiales bacterium GWF2_38_85]|nr:MAG: hypothetical protein A2Y17_02025 [Clostridiales bacterium GWF2_38_85]HBL85142.1 hypothetical protein [Clostridiales bacterium]
MNHKQKAIELFNEGYNCAQSVFAAFCDVTGMEFEEAIKLSSSFGGGMGRLREVCGAVSAMFMITGILYGYTNPTDSEAKAEHYKQIQLLAEKFKEKNGSIICRDILIEAGVENVNTNYIPEARTKEYYEKRPCAEYVGDAAEILDEYIKNHK